MTTKKLTRITLAFAPEHEDLITALLALHVPWGWEDQGQDSGQRMLIVHLDRPEQAAEIHAMLQEACPGISLTLSSIDDADWTSAWKQYFTPIAIGKRFVVLPVWMAGSPQDAEPLLINPKMAFGTGHHKTTTLCLEALEMLAETQVLCPGKKVLDLGTGSGILAIAAAKLGLQGRAIDIDPVAIDNARENLELNAVTKHIHVAAGTLELLESEERFSCILANILANPLIDMAPELVTHLEKNGVLILSGILKSQAQLVAEAYTKLGLLPPEITQDGEWVRLVFRT